ncbi:MAG: class I tRNA ligase family protein, partial [Candidatus Eisenbacteria bacterium]
LTRYWKMVEDVSAMQPVSRVVAGQGSGPAPAGWAAAGPARELRRRVHQLTQQICDDMDRFHLNTAVSGLMQLVNSVQDYQAAGGDPSAVEVREAAEIATRLLAPLAPHTAEGAWEVLGYTNSVALASWPSPAADALESATKSLVVQVNGKLRAHVLVPAGADQETIRRVALADEKVARMTEGKKVAQVIVVPGRLVNVVLE